MAKALFLKTAQAKKKLPTAVKSAGLVLAGTVAGAILTQKLKPYLKTYSKFTGVAGVAAGAAGVAFAGNDMVSDFSKGVMAGAGVHVVLDLMGSPEAVNGLNGFDLTKWMGIQKAPALPTVAGLGEEYQALTEQINDGDYNPVNGYEEVLSGDEPVIPVV